MSATRDFAGKRIFVTGGTSGIGRELAGALARAGADVVVSGTSEASVARLKAAHPNLDGMVLDLADDAGITDTCERLKARFGRLDMLVNNAGIQRNYRFSPGSTVAAADIDGELAANLAGPVKLTASLLPLMAKGGTVVNVSSGTAWTGKPDAAVYSAAKAGMTMFSRVLRRQLAPHGIGVVEVYPPVTATAMTAARASHGFATPQAVAARVMAGLRRGEARIVVGKLRLLALIDRISPRIAEAVVARQP